MPPKDLERDNQRYIDRHLRGTQQMQRQLRQTGSAHVFIELSGNETPLYYGELKIKDGKYHAIPRTKASN